MFAFDNTTKDHLLKEDGSNSLVRMLEHQINVTHDITNSTFEMNHVSAFASVRRVRNTRINA